MIKIFLNALFLVGSILLFTTNVSAQVLHFDHGEVEFYTSSILSDIEASTDELEVSLNTETREVEISIEILSFEFEYEMMQDHFNEEYMHSDKFPTATFRGKIDQDISNLTSSVEMNVVGELTIHGITKDISFKATAAPKDDSILVKCKFPIVFKDFGVEEPSILKKSVAKDVEFKSILYLK